MKTRSVLALVLVAMGGMSGSAVADDITAFVFCNGWLSNQPSRQSIQATFRGTGEFGFLNLDAELSGTVVSQPQTRIPQKNLYGKYPVNVDLRVGRSGISASDSFGANVEVFRRRIKISKVGWITLSRPINPTKSGRQRVSGKGFLAYNF